MLLVTLSPAVVFAAPVSAATTSSSSGTPAGGDWTSFIFNYNDSRFQSSSTVTSSNVGQLTQAWFIDTQYGVTGTPIVQDGLVYFADWGGNVYCAQVSTGAIVWQTNVGGAISSTVGLGNGMVFVEFGPSGSNTEVVALSQTTGAIVWQTVLKTSENAVWTSPTIYNGLIYAGAASAGQENESSWKGEIYALNENTGAVVWSFQTAGGSGGAGVWGSVVVDPTLNSIYFGTGNSYSAIGTIGYAYSIISLNAMTGKLNWFYRIYSNEALGADRDFGSTPNLFTVYSDGQRVKAIGLGNKNGIYYILNRQTGALLDQYQIGSTGHGIIGGLPGFYYPGGNVNNPELFIPSSTPGTLSAFYPESNTVAWTFSTPGSMASSSVAVVPGAILFGDADGNLYAVSWTNGAQLFHTTLPYGVWGGVTVAEGMVFVGDFSITNEFGSSPNMGLTAYTT